MFSERDHYSVSECHNEEGRRLRFLRKRFLEVPEVEADQRPLQRDALLLYIVYEHVLEMVGNLWKTDPLVPAFILLDWLFVKDEGVGL